MRIGYVLKKYPRLSETFVISEILGVEEAGHHVSIFSLTAAMDPRFHADVGRVKGSVCYLPTFTAHTMADAFRYLAEREDTDPTFLSEASAFLDALQPDRYAKILHKALALAREVELQHLEHLHAHFMTIAAHATYLVHLLTGIPYTVTCHAKDIFRETVDGCIFRRIAARAKKVITVCDYNQRYIADRFFEGEESSLVRVYNGQDLRAITPKSLEGREPDLILAVGRLVEKKGFSFLLQAAAKLRASGRRFRIVIVGDGDLRESLLIEKNDLGLGDCVQFAGPKSRDEVLELMGRARVLVAPSVVGEDGNRDALPTVLVEALAAGLPSISTEVGGIPEIIEHGSEGWICAPGDVNGLTDALAEALDDDATWCAMSKRGTEKAWRKFDRSATIPELLQVFAAHARDVELSR